MRNAGWAAYRGQSRAGQECWDFVGRALGCADRGRCRHDQLGGAAVSSPVCAFAAVAVSRPPAAVVIMLRREMGLMTFPPLCDSGNCPW
jgi:hypothetical protein